MSEEEINEEPLPSLSREYLKKFIYDYCDGKILISAQIRDPNDIGLVFMPLMLGAFSEETMKNIGIVYEYYDKAGPRSINGYPVFFSLRAMNKEDWNICRVAINKELDRRESSDPLDGLL